MGLNLALGDTKKEYYSVEEMAEINSIGQKALMSCYQSAVAQARMVGCGFIVVRFPNRSVRPVIACMSWVDVINELTKMGCLGRVEK